MSLLTIYSEHQPQRNTSYTDFTAIQSHLNSLGVLFERWSTDYQITNDIEQHTVLLAYRESIDKLRQEYHFQSMDVIHITPDYPKKEEIRKKFLAEHIHDDFEIRFFIEGRGLFYLHVEDKVYVVLCEKGDLISVPANTKHWFDMGENPDFACIRLFTNAYGWVASFTDDPIVEGFPLLEQFVAEFA